MLFCRYTCYLYVVVTSGGAQESPANYNYQGIIILIIQIIIFSVLNSTTKTHKAVAILNQRKSYIQPILSSTPVLART